MAPKAPNNPAPAHLWFHLTDHYPLHLPPFSQWLFFCSSNMSLYACYCSCLKTFFSQIIRQPAPPHYLGLSCNATSPGRPPLTTPTLPPSPPIVPLYWVTVYLPRSSDTLKSKDLVCFVHAHILSFSASRMVPSRSQAHLKFQLIELTVMLNELIYFPLEGEGPLDFPQCLI